MAFRLSNNWEVKWYGKHRAELLVDVFSDGWPPITQITWRTYSYALESKCERCDEQNETVELRHQNTLYEDDWKNYATLCADCQHDADEYWKERWDDLDADLRAGIAGI